MSESSVENAGSVPEPAARPKNPGSRRAGLIALVLTLLLYPTVFVVQHQSPPAPEPPEPGVLQPAGGDAQFEIMGRLLLKLGEAFGNDPSVAASLRAQLEKAEGLSPEDELRLAIAEGELVDTGAALKVLDEWKNQKDAPDEELETDHALLRRVYEQGSDSVTETERERLKERFGWFGRLALVHDRSGANAEHDELLSGGLALMLVLLAVGAGATVAFVAGLVLFIVALVRLGSGKLRCAFVPPSPGGSVYLEMFALLLGGFLTLKLLGTVLDTVLDPVVSFRVALALQWLLVGVLLWPRIRGVSWARARHDLGWHSGRGVLREIGAGLIGYLAGLPLYVGAVVVTVVLIFLSGFVRSAVGGEPAPAPENPIMDAIQHAGVVELVMLFALATVWAPLVEETIFRGALYRTIRARVGCVLAAVLTAALFGAMHSYSVLLLFPVATLGFIFAMIREWRGSLVAPMTAHALHNGTALGIVITILALLN